MPSKGNKGSKDKGGKENRKKPQHTIKEKRKIKKQKDQGQSITSS